MSCMLTPAAIKPPFLGDSAECTGEREREGEMQTMVCVLRWSSLVEGGRKSEVTVSVMG